MPQVCLLFFLATTALVAGAETLPQWQIVPEESHLTFTGTQNNAPVTGEFKQFTAEIGADSDNFKAISIHIVVDMNSISASYADLKATLSASDWFDVKAFPKADFKATQLNKTNGNTYEAQGTLTIRDKSVPVTLTFTVDFSKKNHAIVDGHTTLKRKSFGCCSAIAIRA